MPDTKPIPWTKPVDPNTTYYTFESIAQKLGVSIDVARKWFRREPGVLHHGRVYRIPPAVFERVVQRMTIQVKPLPRPVYDFKRIKGQEVWVERPRKRP